MSKLSLADRIQTRGIFFQLRWIGTLLSIDKFRVAIKSEVMRGLIGIVKRFPDTPIASLSIEILSEIKKTFSTANKHALALRSIRLKLREISERKQSQ